MRATKDMAQNYPLKISQRPLWFFDNEEFWRSCHPFLLARGYQLRPRYDPDWNPSWTKEGEIFFQAEHNIPSMKEAVLDATRIADGKKVVLKRIESDHPEIGICRHLQSLRDDPRNRTIPILDFLVLPETRWTIIVMPYARRFTFPPFHCPNEFIEAMTQYLEGLQFMHDNNIVHFDIAPQNMLMDESEVVPRGSHFALPETHHAKLAFFYWRDRCSVGPTQYYYIDFGLSLYFPEGKESARHLGTLRTFPTIPELSDDVPYNPFYVDIYQLGLTMQRVINDYYGLEDFLPVAVKMLVLDPQARPEPRASLEHMRSIASKISPSRLSGQIWEKNVGYWKKLSRWLWGGFPFEPGRHC
ncbi:unnamed protein product [Mycena citricolor]|uniref:Protein kinase domain-containing protein n=1 Tax=Mycena citricolor TaxID=2018698 RepID=A0AAD2HKS3_9AGAR|nr:unnamed protein product [Mycena citricolor]